MWQAEVSTLLLLLSVPSWTITLQETLQRSHNEHHFETILLLQHRNQLPCDGMEQMAAAATWPTLRLNNEANYYLRSSQSTEMLALICLDQSQQINTETWQALATNLNNMRHVRVLVLLEEVKARALQQIQNELTEITQQLGFPHVVLLLSTGSAYQLQPYAKQPWLRIQPNSSRPIFSNLDNYHRLVARTLPDQMRARSLVYKDKKTGQLKFTGFVARLITEFATKHNITLQMEREVETGEKFPLVVLRNMTLNGTLNLPMTLCGYEVSTELGIFSYPFDMPSWFIMVPCAREIPRAQVYLLLWNWKVLTLMLISYIVFTLLDATVSCVLMGKKLAWNTLLFNERMISGILGQGAFNRSNYTTSFRVVQAQLFIVGVLISTLIAAHLKTLLTKLPTEKPITNFQELQNSHLQVYFEQTESFYLRAAMQNSQLQYIATQVEYLPADEFFSRRNNLSQLSAFSMTSAEWNIIKRQQELFHQPLKCFHYDLIFRLNLLMSVPLEANSIFARPLETFMHRIHSAGLMKYWRDESIKDLISLGQIDLKDPYHYEPFREFKVNDLFWVWLIIPLGLLFSSLAFICELLSFRIKVMFTWT
ncbi:hypothetical protein KR093_011389 [Drosophila rubida]|uniref:Uncharacterized protein n=1 Tax=Drosophila rubida TaxID=30044 RepID=A0AAD4PMP3_9MUSC|nr:hypothetical protein KR093_011389 [Drosophila rubida]